MWNICSCNWVIVMEFHLSINKKDHGQIQDQELDLNEKQSE